MVLIEKVYLRDERCDDMERMNGTTADVVKVTRKQFYFQILKYSITKRGSS